jgi:hypothetical protein
MVEQHGGDASQSSDGKGRETRVCAGEPFGPAEGESLAGNVVEAHQPKDGQTAVENHLAGFSSNDEKAERSRVSWESIVVPQ